MPETMLVGLGRSPASSKGLHVPAPLLTFEHVSLSLSRKQSDKRDGHIHSPGRTPVDLFDVQTHGRLTHFVVWRF